MSSDNKPSAPHLKLSEEEERGFREIFNLVDRDKGGSISKEELAQLMNTLGINASPQELELMINEIDQNNDGEIQFEEFVAVMSKKVQASYSAEEVKAAFQVFEGKAPSGFIRLEDLERALTVYGTDRLTQDQVADLISQIETNQNGYFDYESYINLMMSE
jgi:Ca2+-binding EF-hand superfamily protein